MRIITANINEDEVNLRSMVASLKIIRRQKILQQIVGTINLQGQFKHTLAEKNTQGITLK